MERQTTIKKLFHEDGIQFGIPSYQRAYSWEVDRDKEQVKQFITDIKEQNPDKKYFLGHFLFEKDNYKDTKYWIIDGQQRITTVVIFFSCLIKELEKREKLNGKIKINNDEILEIWRIKERYIKIGKNYKFHTVDYDNPFFISYVYENNDHIIHDTSSSQRIVKAKRAFEDILKTAELNEILNWKKIIDEATITTFEVNSKVQATQIFAFQNDRGKDLTALEKLKAFLMHKLYDFSNNNNIEDQIRNIEYVFAEIYKQSERISYNEDQVLRFHNIAFLKGWNPPLENVKNELKKISNNSDKEEWIISFVHKLKETFIHVEEIDKEADKNCAIADTILLDENNSFPLIIKLYHFHRKDKLLINKLLRYVEIILFKLEYKVADYRTNSIPWLAKHYNGDIEKLENQLEYFSQNGFQEWWDFNGNCKNYFNSTWHYHKNIKYVLWKYENYLREKNRTRKLTPAEFKNKFEGKKLENTTDHITPRNPDFTTYNEHFKNNWLNNIGNLSLMVWGDNSEKKNNNPADKIDLFDSDFYSHKEIRDILQKRKVWGEREIRERRDKILEFIYKYYKLNT
jgi:uncharacterized protein with ParB-like and HNH nuclease domain